jgi:hypothetical protein
MLTEGIHKAYRNKINDTRSSQNLQSIAQGQEKHITQSGTAQIFKTTAVAFLSEATLEEENFGPSNIVVEATKSDLAANNLRTFDCDGFGTDADFENTRLLAILEKSGTNHP